MRLRALALTGLVVVLLTATTTVHAQAADRDGDGLRDWTEERYGLTDPNLPDTDGDGLVDAAEDADGDGLSALGEQRYGTDPGRPDTDGDGIDDGSEDSDGDGLRDALGQDRRPAPADLEPNPKYAWWDRPPNYDDACHGDQLDPELHPCTYGVDASDITVVLFGDSHALQWQPSLKVTAFVHGWQLVTLTKAACPPAQVLSARKDDAAAVSCELWRGRALDWIEEHQPALVLMAGAGRIYKLVDDEGMRIPDADRTAAWTTGLTATLEAMPQTTRAVVLADTPYLRTNPATCLEEDASDLSRCMTLREDAIDLVFDEAERLATEAAGAAYADLNDLICPYSPCPVVFGDVLAWRNRDHLTASFAKALAPSLGAALDAALAEDPAGSMAVAETARPGPEGTPAGA